MVEPEGSGRTIYVGNGTIKEREAGSSSMSQVNHRVVCRLPLRVQLPEDASALVGGEVR
jgi:hypothetical protein